MVSTARAARAAAIHFHVVDGGLTAIQKNSLGTLVRRAHSENAVSFYQLDVSHFSGFAPDYGASYMTYARILLPSLLQVPRVIYLDTDLLVGKDICELWNVDVSDHPVAAAVDQYIQTTAADWPLPAPAPDEPYFNGGAMSVNLDYWRAHRIQEQTLRLITAEPKRFTWWDQTALNALFRGRFRVIDPSWNTFADEHMDFGSDARTVIHYVGAAKPWTRYRRGNDHHVWRAFYRRFVGSSLSLFWESTFRRTFVAEHRLRLLRAVPGAERLVRRRHDGQMRSDSLPAARVNTGALNGYLTARWN